MKEVFTILANDHQILRSGLKASITHSAPYIRFVAELGTFPEIHKHLDIFSTIELLITDDKMPPFLNAIDELKSIKEKYPKLKTIVTTMHSDIAYIKSLIPFCDGVISYLTPEAFSDAIKMIMNGGIYYTFPGINDTKKGKGINKSLS